MYLKYELRLNNCPDRVVTFDLETIKCSLSGRSWRWGSGELNSKRWVPFMCGIGHLADNRLEIEVSGGFDEFNTMETILTQLGMYTSNTKGVAHFASKNLFDEMILRGRFISARRPLARLAGDWPHFELGSDPEDLRFVQIAPTPTPFDPFRASLIEPVRPFYRGQMVGGKLMCPRTLHQELDIWVDHCARDIVENLWRLCPETIEHIMPTLIRFYNRPRMAGEYNEEEMKP